MTDLNVVQMNLQINDGVINLISNFFMTFYTVQICLNAFFNIALKFEHFFDLTCMLCPFFLTFR